MSQRDKTVPPTGVTSRSSQSGRSELIAREKNEKRSAKERSTLDDRFHRTYLTLSCVGVSRRREFRIRPGKSTDSSAGSHAPHCVRPTTARISRSRAVDESLRPKHVPPRAVGF